MVPTCSTCAFHRFIDESHGSCRAALPIVRDANWRDNDAEFAPEACWPTVNPEDWCGEWTDPDAPDEVEYEVEQTQPRWPLVVAGAVAGLLVRGRRR